ncbi:uncharacterized protein MELLADRAFT_37347 [Melampsora larici-populina 98AG31]|uniref:Secreted protein n=1 Tax=Melampsora larici-populina (strain 98AG31 / pathotype 3-4-7) TaxID=747676 RepID=F4RT28_MELLP|nr:uncharacterized protein MELLADRAFT_37347 [Melampsora larici-populina 98AG31]EGG04434.1 secreted protein [Melampsora larici-populina 98AG31]
MKIHLSLKAFTILSIVSLGGIHAMVEPLPLDQQWTDFTQHSTSEATLSNLMDVWWNEPLTMPEFKSVAEDRDQEAYFDVQILHSTGPDCNRARSLGIVSSNNRDWTVPRRIGKSAVVIEEKHLFAGSVVFRHNLPPFIKIRLCQVPKPKKW